MRQVSEMILEGRTSCGHLPSQPEGGNLVGESLFKLWFHIQDYLAKDLKRRSFGLIEGIQIGGHLVACHGAVINRA